MYTSVQDNGRYHMSHLGVPVSGAMDRKSASAANLILGNDQAASFLECTILGPELRFTKTTRIAITGARVDCFLNDAIIPQDSMVDVRPSDVLRFGTLREGARFYIGIQGGLLSPMILGSASACITSGILSILKKGDTIGYDALEMTNDTSVFIETFTANNTLDIVPGPEFSRFDTASLQKLDNREYTIHHYSNRMAYRVEERLDVHNSVSILSGPTLPGTVQLTPHGDIIILMRDCQTTGGYPRIAQLSEKAICHLSQLKPKEKFRFNLLL